MSAPAAEVFVLPAGPETLNGIDATGNDIDLGPLGALRGASVVSTSAVAVRKMARAHRLHYFWQRSGSDLQVHFTDGASLPAAETRDADAAAALFGPTLDELDMVHEAPVSWTTARRPGWRAGGSLGVCCPRPGPGDAVCGAHLEWLDWWHPAATRMRNSAYVYCAVHGQASATHVRTMREVIDARRLLDSLVWAHPATVGSHRIYAFDVQGVGRPVIYVGETTKRITERHGQHCSPDHQPKAQVLKPHGRSAGPLRQDLVPWLPPLGSQATARAAERFVAATLQYRGLEIAGDGRH
ncbi:hypothetical protein [Georgenia muralis]|uniref:hypothetical protein n=1 Tax=Georgenia muralis TaxID=154117 RepID=UPI000F4FD02A|nr:hypothetical protein [Georgenia muralis]